MKNSGVGVKVNVLCLQCNFLGLVTKLKGFVLNYKNRGFHLIHIKAIQCPCSIGAVTLNCQLYSEVEYVGCTK